MTASVRFHGRLMETLPVLHSQLPVRSHSDPTVSDHRRSTDAIDDLHTIVDFTEREPGFSTWKSDCQTELCGEFFKELPAEAMKKFRLISRLTHCPNLTVLLKEEQEPLKVYFLLQGQAILSMSSFNGRRLIVGIAHSGEILGLVSAISGSASE